MNSNKRKGYESANLIQYQIEKRKPVGTDLGEIFESLSQAAQEIQGFKSGICACLNGRLKTYKKRQWFLLDLEADKI